MEDALTEEESLQCFTKAHRSILENRIRTSTFKEHKRLSLQLPTEKNL